MGDQDDSASSKHSLYSGEPSTCCQHQAQHLHRCNILHRPPGSSSMWIRESAATTVDQEIYILQIHLLMTNTCLLTMPLLNFLLRISVSGGIGTFQSWKRMTLPDMRSMRHQQLQETILQLRRRRRNQPMILRKEWTWIPSILT